jgi:hypothetical protein
MTADLAPEAIHFPLPAPQRLPGLQSIFRQGVPATARIALILYPHFFGGIAHVPYPARNINLIGGGRRTSAPSCPQDVRPIAADDLDFWERQLELELVNDSTLQETERWQLSVPGTDKVCSKSE